MSIEVVPIAGARISDPGKGSEYVAGQVEGLALTGQGAGRNRMFLHGVADSPFTGESQSTVAVMLDDARLTYSAPDPDIRLFDVDRVEVLKGPQGSLYGTGALGGIYRIVTNRPVLDVTSLSATLGGEAAVQGGVGLTGSAVANLPIVQDRAALRIAGYIAQQPGWVDTGDRKDSNSTRVTGGRVGLGLDAGNDWRLDLTGLVQFLEARDSQYVYKYGARSRPAQAPEPHDNDLRHLSLRLARHSGDLDIVIGSAMTWHEVRDTFDATMGATGLGLPDPGLLDIDRQYRVWDSEARASGKIGKLGWLAGITHIEARQANVWTLLAAATPTKLTFDDDRHVTNDSAAFGEVTLELADRFNLNLGGRLFHSSVTETRLLPTGPVTQELQRTGVTPSAALSWQPSAGRLFYLRYGSAFRQGGTDIGSTGKLESLKGDELRTIEAGWRETTPGGARLELGAHYSWWSNVQSDMLRPSGLIEAENAGDARIAGFDALFELPLARSWHVNAGATFEDAALVRNALGIALEDLRLPVVPEYTLRGSVRHEFLLGGHKSDFALHLRYIGPARLSFDPALDRRMGNLFESGIEGRTEIGGFEVSLAIDNPLSGNGDVFSFGNPLRIATMHQYTPQRPLTVSTALTKRF